MAVAGAETSAQAYESPLVREQAMQLRGELVGSMRDADYAQALAATEKLLLLEPDNRLAQEFLPLLKEKLALDEASSDEDDSGESSSSESEEESEDSDIEETDEEEDSEAAVSCEESKDRAKAGGNG